MKKLILLSLILFIGAKAEAVSYGVIKGDNVNIRTDKSLSSKVIGSLNKFDTVTIIGDSGKEYEIDGQSYLWYNIAHKGKTGWIYGKYVNILPTEPRKVTYYIDLLEKKLNIVFTKEYDDYYSYNNYNDRNPSQTNYYLNPNEPGYLNLKSDIHDEFCMNTVKEVYQYDDDKLKLILTGADVIHIHTNFILSIQADSKDYDRIYSIEVYNLKKQVKDVISSSPDCLFEKVFEKEENREEGISLHFDYKTLTLRVYMEKLNQTVSVLKFKNGVFQQ